MRLAANSLGDYVAQAALLLERYGATLDVGPGDDLILDVSPGGIRSFRLRAFLPDGRQPPLAVVEVREVWRATDPDDGLERSDYTYELLDHDRDARLAFHLHDAEWFIRRHDVVVHEHCERPIGRARCAHAFGQPVRDAFDGIERLIDAWLDSAGPDCDARRCLD